jgi:hypothetical protein
VALFALLGFAFVPLGRKTALEHTRDILSTEASRGAFRELGSAIDRLRGRLVEMLVTDPPPPRRRDADGPSPEPPRLGQRPRH